MDHPFAATGGAIVECAAGVRHAVCASPTGSGQIFNTPPFSFFFSPLATLIKQATQARMRK